MSLMRIVGTRPQLMQVPMLAKELADRGYQQILLHTGQHYDSKLHDEILSVLGIPTPDINLRAGSGLHGEMTAKMLSGIETVLIDTKPSLVILDGDTNSTLAGALAASKLHIPIMHIEAGLRDWDRKRPEEINRIMTDHVSTINCAPIERAMDNLKNEGLLSTATLTGDVMLDCFIHFQKKADISILQQYNLKPEAYHLATVHRPENTEPGKDSRFFDIMDAFDQLDKPVVFPIHPRALTLFNEYRSQTSALNIIPLPAVDYLKSLALSINADAVFTDSGGLSREAVWGGRKCIMLFKKETWHDLLERGYAQIGKGDTDTILSAYTKAQYPPIQKTQAIYGDGHAAIKIADRIKTFLNEET